ncbi:MAG TPA: hypothetical protein VJ773_07065 [Gemmatimonadales bacterium]|nr:hypothetical protein [Gemmatimonadales bacterium]
MTPPLLADDAFGRALDRLRPVAAARGLRLALLERPAGPGDHGFAEFAGRSLRLRLVWEADARALWVEWAQARGAEVVGRWTDIEWTLAGGRLPLDLELGPERVERLARAAEAFLSGAGA